MVNFFKAEPAPKKKRKPLRRMSIKRKAIVEQRKDFVAEQLAKREWCEAGPIIGRHTGHVFTSKAGRWRGCRFRSTELHEPLTRARAPGAETILDVENSVAICPICHAWIHANPADAEHLGLLRSSRGL